MNKSNKKESVMMQNIGTRIGNFDEVNLGYDGETAIKEAERCLNCKLKPCVKGCPVNVDIPKFIEKIRCKDIDSAYNILCSTNSFPAVCGRVCPQEKQCEAKCVRGKNGEPVAVGALERYVADKAMEKENNTKKIEIIHNNSDTSNHKIAVVGSGPSGLSCAAELLKMGFKVTIFEALHELGGVLAYGIPEFRLPRKILEFEIKKLELMGVNVVKNFIVGKTCTINELFENGFSAVYIATGAGLPKFMNIKGENLSGIYSANEFLTRINLMKAYKNEYDTPIKKSKKVLVIGGGNVAIDAARCALRADNSEVFIMYRRSEEEMPARVEEIHHAKEEGVKFLFLKNPIEFIGNNGKVCGVKYVNMMLSDVDSSGRRSVVADTSKTYEMRLDSAIIAIGNGSNRTVFENAVNLEIDKFSRITIKKGQTRTSVPLVYAGGDIVTGAATVILALGAGKRAAEEIYEDVIIKKTRYK